MAFEFETEYNEESWKEEQLREQCLYIINVFLAEEFNCSKSYQEILRYLSDFDFFNLATAHNSLGKRLLNLGNDLEGIKETYFLLLKYLLSDLSKTFKLITLPPFYIKESISITNYERILWNFNHLKESLQSLENPKVQICFDDSIGFILNFPKYDSSSSIIVEEEIQIKVRNSTLSVSELISIIDLIIVKISQRISLVQKK